MINRFSEAVSTVVPSRMLGLAVAVLCISPLVPSPVHAQGNIVETERITIPLPIDESVVGSVAQRSPNRAFAYSLLGTALPVGVGGGTALGKNELSGGAVVAIGGAVIGPSLGHFYAQRHGRAIRGIVVRGLAAGMVAIALDSSQSRDDDRISSQCGTGCAALFVGGALLGSVFLVADVGEASRSARIHNETAAGGVRLGVSSLAGPIAGAPGVGVRITF